MSALERAVRDIESPLSPIGHLVPKVTYEEEGVYLDTRTNSLKFVRFSGNEIVALEDVAPVFLLRPMANGYGLSEEELFSLHANDFCGEADDLSCYVFFRFSDSKEFICRPIEYLDSLPVNACFDAAVQTPTPSISDAKYQLGLSLKIRKYATDKDMGHSILVANEGMYLCSSFLKEKYVENPCNVDMNSVFALTRRLQSFVATRVRDTKKLSGWYLKDIGDNNLQVGLKVCTIQNTFKYLPCMVYNRTTGQVDASEWEAMSPKTGVLSQSWSEVSDDIIPVLRQRLTLILRSMSKITVPISLFEVCFVFSAASEEGSLGATKDTSWLLSELSPRLSITGISEISVGNGFKRHESQKGYALVIGIA